MKKTFLVLFIALVMISSLAFSDAVLIGGGGRLPPDPVVNPITYTGPYSYVTDDGSTLVFDGGAIPNVDMGDGTWLPCDQTKSYDVQPGAITFYFGNENFTIDYEYTTNDSLLNYTVDDIANMVNFDVQDDGGCGYTFTQNVIDEAINPDGLTYTFPDDYQIKNDSILYSKIKLDLSEARDAQGIKLKTVPKGIRMSGPAVINLDPDINFSTSQTICGTYTYDNIVINNSALLTVCAWNNTGQNGTVTFNATNFNMTLGSIINASGKGYTGGNISHQDGNGPGAGLASGTGGSAYGSSTNATDMGSGGAYGSGNAPSGGGLVTIQAVNVYINSTILVDAGTPSGVILAGGSAGGGIRILSKNLYGIMNLSSRGSNSGTGSQAGQAAGGAGYGGAGGNGAVAGRGGGGAGGRIYLESCTNTSTINYNVSKGLTGGSTSSQNGTDGTFLATMATGCFPTFNSMNITPSNPGRNSNLSMFCNYSSTSNISNINWTIYKNQVLNLSGNLTNITSGKAYNLINVSYLNTSYLQNWTLSCSATDTNGATPFTNTTVMINDTAPYMGGTVTLSPNPPSSGSDLTCNPGTAIDSDGDVTTVYYAWQNSTNSSNASATISLNYTTQILKAGNITTNGSYNCIVWIGDGIYNSSNYSSGFFTANGIATPLINASQSNVTSNGILNTALNPTNNNTFITFTVNWTGAGGANNGTLYVCQNIGFTGSCTGGEWCHNNTILSYNNLTTCTLNLAGLSQGNFAAYILGNDKPVYSNPWQGTFYVNHPPTGDINLSDPADTTLFPPTPITPHTLNWSSSVTDIDAGDSFSYYVYYDGNNPPTTLQDSTTILNSTTPLLYTGTFYWQVKAIDSYGYIGSTSAVYSFIVGTATPPPGGGGGAPPPAQIVINSTNPYCGDGICQSSENVGNCAADCSVNVDDIFSLAAFSKPGFVQMLFYISVGGLVLVILYNEFGKGRRG